MEDEMIEQIVSEIQTKEQKIDQHSPDDDIH